MSISDIKTIIASNNVFGSDMIQLGINSFCISFSDCERLCDISFYRIAFATIPFFLNPFYHDQLSAIYLRTP